jgi:hypothetical protein
MHKFCATNNLFMGALLLKPITSLSLQKKQPWIFIRFLSRAYKENWCGIHRLPNSAETPMVDA